MGRLASAVASLSTAFAQGFSPDRADSNAGHRETLITILPQAGGWGKPENVGAMAHSDIFRDVAWTHVAIQNVADKVASLPLRVYRGDPEGDFEPVARGQDVRRIIDNPSKGETQFDLKMDLALFLGINGEAPIALDGDIPGAPFAGIPKALRVLNPESLLDPKSAASAGADWIYTEENGARTPYQIPATLIMVKLRDPKSRKRGLSPLLAAWDAVIQDKLAVLYQKAKLRYGSAVGYSLEYDDKTVQLTPPVRKELRAEFDQMHGGPSRAGRLFIPDRGGKLKVLDANNREMEYNLLRKAARDEMIGVLGLQPIEAGIIENANRSNSEVQALLVWRNKVLPLCALIENALNSPDSGLMWRFGPDYFVGFDLAGVESLQEDKDAKTTRVVSLVTAGVYSPNKALETLGDVPETGNPAMDLHYMGSFPIDAPADTQSAEVTRRRQRAPKRAANFWSDPDRRELAQRILDVQRTTLEAGWRSTMKSYLTAQAERFLRPLRDLNPDGPTPTFSEISRAVSQADEEARLREAVGMDVRACVTTGIRWGNKMVRRARKRAVGEEAGFRELSEDDFDLDPETVDFIMNIEQKLARQVTDTTWGQVKDAVRVATEEGETVKQTVDRLETYFTDRRSRWELQRIARTETTKAANGGTMLAFSASGVVEKKQWLSARDENTRGDHFAVDHATTEEPIPLDEDFRVGSDSLAYPGDPGAPIGQTANCRCTIVPVVEGE